ncbi:unnamed protein product [Camellia sinensis]
MENKMVLSEKNMTGINGEEENNELTNKEGKDQKLGGMKTMPFIVTTVGVAVNLITCLIQKLNLPIVKASNILTNFGGASS